MKLSSTALKSIPYRNFWENNDAIFNNAVAKTRAGTNLNISKLSVQHRESQLTDGQPVKVCWKLHDLNAMKLSGRQKILTEKNLEGQKFCLRIKIQTKFWLKKIGKQKTCLKTTFLSDYNGGKCMIFKFQTVFHTIWFHKITREWYRLLRIDWTHSVGFN